MKIQDIFNLPKNRGGAKLFNRIMNRYGIPKEDSKELKNNIDNSSSGGGGEILYLKYNGERYYMYVINNPMSKAFPIIAGVAIFNSGGGSNDIRSYTYNDIYMEIHEKAWLIDFKPFMAKINPKKIGKYYVCFIIFYNFRG